MRNFLVRTTFCAMLAAGAFALVTTVDAGASAQSSDAKPTPASLVARAEREEKAVVVLRKLAATPAPAGLSKAKAKAWAELHAAFGEVADQIAEDAAKLRAAAKGSLQSQIDAMMNNNLMFLAVQTKVQNISQTTQLMSNIMKADSDAALNTIRNMRS